MEKQYYKVIIRESRSGKKYKKLVKRDKSRELLKGERLPIKPYVKS